MEQATGSTALAGVGGNLFKVADGMTNADAFLNAKLAVSKKSSSALMRFMFVICSKMNFMRPVSCVSLQVRILVTVESSTISTNLLS